MSCFITSCDLIKKLSFVWSVLILCLCRDAKTSVPVIFLCVFGTIWFLCVFFGVYLFCVFRLSVCTFVLCCFVHFDWVFGYLCVCILVLLFLSECLYFFIVLISGLSFSFHIVLLFLIEGLYIFVLFCFFCVSIESKSRVGTTKWLTTHANRRGATAAVGTFPLFFYFFPGRFSLFLFQFS